MIPRIVCFWGGTVKQVAPHHAIAAVRHHHRRVRRAIAVTCFVVGGTSAALIPPLFYVRPPVQTAFFGPPDIPTLPQPIPETTQPEQPTQPIPEPPSLALLATAVGLFVIARWPA